MKIDLKDPPRAFNTGNGEENTFYDHGCIHLENNEMLTFKTESGSGHDVCRKKFGFYATQSINARTRNEGFKTALIRNPQNRYYVLLVEDGKEDLFYDYLKEDGQVVVCWLNDEESLKKISSLFEQ